MKTYQIEGKEVYVYHASALSSGYGHKKITVELVEEFSGESMKFSATTSNMTDYDAIDMEAQDRYEVLYELIDSKIEDNVYEWLQSLD